MSSNRVRGCQLIFGRQQEVVRSAFKLVRDNMLREEGDMIIETLEALEAVVIREYTFLILSSILHVVDDNVTYL